MVFVQAFKTTNEACVKGKLSQKGFQNDLSEITERGLAVAILAQAAPLTEARLG